MPIIKVGKWVGINDDIGNVIRKSNLYKRHYYFYYITRFLNMNRIEKY